MTNIKHISKVIRIALLSWWTLLVLSSTASAQLTDQTQTPNAAGRGIALSLEQQIGDGQGDINTPNTSQYDGILPVRSAGEGRFSKENLPAPKVKAPELMMGLGDPSAHQTTLQPMPV